MSILEKCEIPNEIIKLFKKKGLIIPEKIEPVKEPLRSPSEEWFYSIADRFTPPLTEIELEIFKNTPHLLSLQILTAVDLLFDVSDILYDGLEKAKKNLRDEEAVAAVLAILRIFHGCMDFNYLKYDRHLEYHEYKKSPVGHYWLTLKKMCLKVAKDKKIPNPEEWANQKVLEVISGPRRTMITSEYAICCKKIYNKLKKVISDANRLSIKEILEELKKEKTQLFKIIKKYSEYFYRTPEEFIRDCIQARYTNPPKEVMGSKKKSAKAIEKIKSLLNDNESNEFERVVEIIEDFLAIQELEGLIFYGCKPGFKIHLFDILVEAYDQLKSLITPNFKFIKPEFKETVAKLFKAENAPLKFVAVRNVVYKGISFFNDDIQKLYYEELKRWKEIAS